MLAKIHPLDIASLQKGDVIARDLLEEITNEKHGTQAHALAVLKLRHWIEESRAAENKPIVIRQRGDVLVVLFDHEVIEYSRRGSDSGLRKLGRACTNLSRADRSNLTERQLSRYDCTVKIIGARYLAATQVSPKRIVNSDPPPDISGVKRLAR